MVRWSRHYEARMGLAPAGIVFGNLEGKCGRVFLSQKFDGEWIGYDPRAACRASWTAQDVALHEECHRRYAHLYVPLTDAQQHAEVATCARHYR